MRLELSEPGVGQSGKGREVDRDEGRAKSHWTLGLEEGVEPSLQWEISAATW